MTPSRTLMLLGLIGLTACKQGITEDTPTDDVDTDTDIQDDDGLNWPGDEWTEGDPADHQMDAFLQHEQQKGSLLRLCCATSGPCPLATRH